MKYILIVIAISLANPQEPAVLAHKGFATYEQCMAAGAVAKANVPKELKVSGFCVPAEDLMESGKVS